MIANETISRIIDTTIFMPVFIIHDCTVCHI